MNTPDLERRLAHLLRTDADAAMTSINTEEDLKMVKHTVTRRVRTRRILGVAAVIAALTAAGTLALTDRASLDPASEALGSRTPAVFPSSESSLWGDDLLADAPVQASAWGDDVRADDPDPATHSGLRGSREFHCGGGPKSRQASPDAQLRLKDVRLGSDGFPADRVVFEFTGVGTPGWTVEAVGGLAALNRGGTITVSATITGVEPHALVPRAVHGVPTSVVKELTYTGAQPEDSLQGFIELSSGWDICVNLLEHPTRVVISFPHGG